MAGRHPTPGVGIQQESRGCGLRPTYGRGHQLRETRAREDRHAPLREGETGQRHRRDELHIPGAACLRPCERRPGTRFCIGMGDTHIPGTDEVR